MITEIAAIAEIIASIGVILSLLFVGFQMRDSNRQTRMSAIQDTLGYEIQVTAQFIANAETWDNIMNSKPIAEGPERRKAIQLFNLLMTETEHRFFLHRQGYLTNRSWEARLEVFREDTPPIFHIWRKSGAGRSHSPEFLAFLDRIMLDKRGQAGN